MRLSVLIVIGGCLLAIAACSSPERSGGDPAPTATVRMPPPTLMPMTTPTATSPPTSTPTATPTATATPSPTATASPTATPEPTATPTPTPDLPPLAIAELTLHDIDGSPLEFLSADEHTLFGGYTLIHGTFAITGEGEISDVVLEVTDDANGATFEVPLAQAVREQVLQPLGDAGRVEITASQLLFEIPSTSFASFDKTQDGYVSLSLKVRTTDGREAVRGADYRYIQKLVLYTADNRYFVGEEAQGGNSWVTPSVKALAEQLPDVQYGDFSNMNGGYFPPHVSHQRGVDIDVWFFGYNDLDGAAAQFMLDLLNQPGIIERVELAYVAYAQTDGDPFWEAIRDVVLVDGRMAGEVFQPEADHDTHFHLRLWE